MFSEGNGAACCACTEFQHQSDLQSVIQGFGGGLSSVQNDLQGTSEITLLPPYLSVKMVRFFYKVDVQQKAKILRKVRPQRQ